MSDDDTTWNHYFSIDIISHLLSSLWSALDLWNIIVLELEVEVVCVPITFVHKYS